MLNKRIKFISFFFLLIGCFSIFNAEKVTTASECGDNCRLSYPDDEEAQKDCEDKCKDLEKEADKLKDKIEVKNEQANTLNNQLDYINNQQNINQRNLNSTIKNINDLSEKINTLEKDIKEKEKEIAYQKKILSVLMQSYYDYNQQGVLGLILFNEAVASPFEKTDYIEQSGMRASELLENIKESQNKLISDQEELKKSQEESVALKSKLQDEKYNLQLTENTKQTLLTRTQGEEAKYQALLAEIEQQKLELFNFSSFGSYNIKSSDRPKDKDKLSTSWYYSQTDSRWGNLKIGVSSSKMKDYGCAITSVAMMYTYYGKKYTPKDILNKSDFAGDLIYWPSGWHHLYTTSYKSEVDSILKNDGVAIVHLKFSGGGHFIVIGGKDKKDYIVHDPYFGSNLYLSASLRLLGAHVDRVIYK